MPPPFQAMPPPFQDTLPPPLQALPPLLQEAMPPPFQAMPPPFQDAPPSAPPAEALSSPLSAHFITPPVLDQGNGPKQYLIGLAFGALGAGVWAAVMVTTGYEVGWLAWGIGFLVGIGARYGAGEDGTQVEAVLLATISTLVLAKVLAITMGVGMTAEQLAPEMIEDKYALSETLVHQWATAEKVPSWMALPIDPDAAGYDQTLYNKTYYQAFDQLEATPQQELEVLALAASKQAILAIPILTRFGYIMSLWDILWGFLAFGAAYKVSQTEN